MNWKATARRAVLTYLLRQMTLRELVALGYKVKVYVTRFAPRPKVSRIKTVFNLIRKKVAGR